MPETFAVTTGDPDQALGPGRRDRPRDADPHDRRAGSGAAPRSGTATRRRLAVEVALLKAARPDFDPSSEGLARRLERLEQGIQPVASPPLPASAWAGAHAGRRCRLRSRSAPAPVPPAPAPTPPAHQEVDPERRGRSRIGRVPADPGPDAASHRTPLARCPQALADDSTGADRGSRSRHRTPAPDGASVTSFDAVDSCRSRSRPEEFSTPQGRARSRPAAS